MSNFSSSSRIDWYSFSFYVGARPDDEKSYRANMLSAFIDLSPVLYDLATESAVEQGGGRRPFHSSFRHPRFTLFYNHVVDHALVEISGEQCSSLDRDDLLIPIITATHARCTRIDLATDIRVGHPNQVADFIASGFSARFRTVSDIQSARGHTYYIGSRKSERMCRVYQYNPPHPRSELLRVEIELKGDRAKQVALALSTNVSVSQATEAASAPYQFISPIWIGRSGSEDMPAFEPIKGKQSENNTLYWIHSQVKPAIQRMMLSGIVPASLDWLEETFLSDLEIEEESGQRGEN